MQQTLPLAGQIRGSVPASQVVNVASVRHRSPFRYPGGKTWLVPFVQEWIGRLGWRPKVFCEPFCGGASIGLSMLFDNLADEVALVELDDDIAAVWETIAAGHAELLARRIGRFEPSVESVRALFGRRPRSVVDRAFKTIVRNRVQRGGILAPGASLMKDGENGRGIKSRWYASTLQERLRSIALVADRLSFHHGDGVQFMRQVAAETQAAFLIDPPYTVAGRRLYAHSEVDHEEIFRVACDLEGEFLMTYDDSPEIRTLAEKYSLDVHTLPMKNTHHRVMYELVISRDLGWARRKS